MITQSQKRTYDFIQEYIAKHDLAPTMAEIAAGIGIKSRGVVHRYVKALEEEGLINMTPNRHRNIHLVSSAKASNTLPLIGRIAAGQPIEAIQDRNTVDIANIFLKEDRYALEVKGDSMIEEGILDGDIVVCKHTESANDGQIVVALVDEQEATLKRLRRNKDKTITLVPANAHYEPMTYEPERVRVQGVFVGLLRFLAP